MTYSTQGVDLDSTIAALHQDPTAMSLDDAIALIENWQQQLEGQEISGDLDELKQALQQGNKALISATLSDLGEYTSAIAAEAPAEVADKVQQLSILLSQMANP